MGPRRWLGYDEVIEGSSGYRGHLPKRKFLIASAAGREGMEPFLVTRYYYCLLINVANARVGMARLLVFLRSESAKTLFHE